MTTHFAKFMGTIKEIEIILEQINLELQNNSDHHFATINQLKANLEQLSLSAAAQDAKKNSQLKHDFKNDYQIYKKELEKPIKQLKNNLNKVQSQLDAISHKITDNSTYSTPNKKPKFSTEEIANLNKYLNVTLNNLNTHQEKINDLDKELDLLELQFKTTQAKLELGDYTKEEEKFIKNLEEFTGKLNNPEYIAIANRELLSEKLQNLLTITNNTQAKPLLTQFEHANGATIPAVPTETTKTKIETAKNLLKIS